MKTSLPWILFIAALIGCVVLWNMLNGSEMSRNSAKSVFLEQEKQLHHDLSRRDARILALENDLSSRVDFYDSVHGGLKSQIKRLKSRVIPVSKISLHTDTAGDYTCCAQAVIRDSVIVAQDTLISSLESENLEILTRGAVIVGDLKSKNALLDSANTSKLNFMISQSDIIESQDKKISKLKQLSKVLGISTGSLAVILALILAL
jgi:hypothetical protein